MAQYLRIEETGSRRETRGLEDDGIARHERRRALAAGHVERKIPRRNDADGAACLPLRIAERAVDLARHRLAAQTDALRDLVIHFLDRGIRFRLRLAIGFAVLASDHGGDLVPPHN